MVNLAKKLRFWGTRLALSAGLALGAGCASTKVGPVAARPAYSGEDVSAEQFPRNEGRGGFSAGLSLRPTRFKFYDAHAWVPAPKGDFILNMMGAEPAKVSLKEGYDCTLSLDTNYQGTVSENVGWYFGLSLGVSGQNIYSGGEDPGKDGDISETKKFREDDTREEPTEAVIKADPSSWNVTPSVGLEYFITDDTSLHMGVIAPFNRFEMTSGALVQSVLNEPRTYEKLRTFTSSGFGVGGEVGIKTKVGNSSVIFIDLSWARQNLRKIGSVDSEQVVVGWKYTF